MDNENNNKKVYDAEDIRRMLNIGKNKVYNFLDDVYNNNHFFKVIRIGKLYKIPKQSFDEWLNKEEGVKNECE